MRQAHATRTTLLGRLRLRFVRRRLVGLARAVAPLWDCRSDARLLTKALFEVEDDSWPGPRLVSRIRTWKLRTCAKIDVDEAMVGVAFGRVDSGVENERQQVRRRQAQVDSGSRALSLPSLPPDIG